MKLILLSFVGLLFFSSLAFAQDKEQSDKENKDKQTQSKTKRTLREKIKSLEKNRLYSADYDKFEDETIVTVSLSVKDESFKLSDLTSKSSTELYGIDLTALFWFEGQELQKDVDEFVLRFTAVSRKWRWSDEKDLIAIIDGERVKLGNGKRVSKVRKGGSVYESLSWTVPKATFEKIANGKSVEVRVGSDEIKFNSKQLQRLKGFLSLAIVD